MIKQRLKDLLQKFRADTRGTVAIEAVILIPILFWAFLAMAVFFDMYRARTTTEKAAFAISDMFSRETAAVNMDYMRGAESLFETISYLNSVDPLRVSVVTWAGDEDDGDYALDWSHSTGMVQGLTTEQFESMIARLPQLVPGERMIVVETFAEYTPLVDVGIGTVEMNTFVFTRPRFAPQLVWEDA